MERNPGPPEGNSVTGITSINAKLPMVIAKADRSVTNLWCSAHSRAGAYALCIQVCRSSSITFGTAPASTDLANLEGKSPGLRSKAPSTGTTVRATINDAINAKLIVRAKFPYIHCEQILIMPV